MGTPTIERAPGGVKPGVTPGGPQAEGTGTACLGIQLLLKSGERATYQLPLPEDLRAGRYRVSTHIEASDGDSERVSTQPFTVR